MKEERTRFPLAWPLNWRRTPPAERRRADFRRYTTTKREVTNQQTGAKSIVKETAVAAVSIPAAIDRLEGQLLRMGAEDLLLSSNVPVTLKGLPSGKAAEPGDTGVAVYLTLDRKPLVFACDKWDRVADNIAAVAQHIDALRRIDRYGVGKIEQAFAGYLALPASVDDWREVLGVGEYATIEQVDAAFIEKAKTAHPDVGGTHDEMARLTAARDLARSVLRQ